MKLTTKIACAALAAWTCGAASAAEPRVGKLVSYDVGRFSIVTSQGERQAHDLMDDLALFQLTLETTLRSKAANTGDTTRIYIVGRREWQKYLMPREGLAGYFMPRRFTNYLVVDGDSDRTQALRIIFHEYTHYFLRSQFAGEYPPWFDEGLAEMFAMLTFKDGVATFGVAVDRVLDARSAEWIPLDRLLAVHNYSPEYMSHRLARGFYGQSWLTVHYGMLENRDFGRKMFQYLHQLNLLVPHEQAVRDNFGDLAPIDKQLFEYSRRSSLSKGGIRIGAAPPLALGAGKPLGEVDALAELANVMFELGTGLDRLKPFVAAIVAREPDSPRAEILRARLAHLEEDDAQFERSIARLATLVRPDDWQTRRDVALVLFDRGRDAGLGRLSRDKSVEAQEQALRLFDEALRGNPGDVASLWGFGSAAVNLRLQLDLAEQRLTAAYKKAPSNAEIACTLAQLHLMNNDAEKALPYLTDTIRYAPSLSMRQWAVDTLRSTRDYLAEKERVDAENEERRASWERRVEETRKKREKEAKARR